MAVDRFLTGLAWTDDGLLEADGVPYGYDATMSRHKGVRARLVDGHDRRLMISGAGEVGPDIPYWVGELAVAGLAVATLVSCAGGPDGSGAHATPSIEPLGGYSPLVLGDLQAYAESVRAGPGVVNPVFSVDDGRSAIVAAENQQIAVACGVDQDGKNCLELNPASARLLPNADNPNESDLWVFARDPQSTDRVILSGVADGVPDKVQMIAGGNFVEADVTEAERRQTPEAPKNNWRNWLERLGVVAKVAEAAVPTAIATATNAPPTEQPKPTATEVQRVFTAEQAAAANDAQLLNAANSVLRGVKQNELGSGWVADEIIRADQGYNYALLVDPRNNEIKGVYSYSEGVVEKVVAGTKSEQGKLLGRVIVVSSKSLEEIAGREVFLNDKIGLHKNPIGKATAQGNLIDWMVEKLAVARWVDKEFIGKGIGPTGQFIGMDKEEKEKFVANAKGMYVQDIVGGLELPKIWLFVAEATEEKRVIPWESGSDRIAREISSEDGVRLFVVTMGKEQWENGITYPTTAGSKVDPLIMVMGNLLGRSYAGGLFVKRIADVPTVGIGPLCGLETSVIGVVSSAECVVGTRPK